MHTYRQPVFFIYVLKQQYLLNWVLLANLEQKRWLKKLHKINANQMKAIVHILVPGITIKVIRYTVVYSILYSVIVLKGVATV